MDLHLQPQFKNASDLKKILKEVNVTLTLEDGREIKTLVVYLPLSSGKSSHSEFFEKVKEAILFNFVFTCTEIEKNLGIQNKQSAEKLFQKAARKLSQHTAQGELGELILFTLLDIYFQAPKILSKVSMKTSRRMPVYGADAVHGQFYDGEFVLFLGESKLHADFKGAASSSAVSIKSAKEKYIQEFDLIESHMDFPNINEELESILLDLLDPFSEKDLSDLIHSPCFIGFSEPDLISNALSEEDFVDKYTELAKTYIYEFFNQIEKQEIGIDKTAILMLPFSCVNNLVTEFIEYMGIEK
ncbi:MULTISPECIES: HamA C-terminal domain-containing protein [unclassified Methylophaga]|uniref:HamA C-terminal domain-containing protein n=1 Tax=unclassified Methylophaga TaxID=2629249 RepID=UPI000C97D01A|nr:MULTISPECIES: DUF1837 domain-containing protein [unclassified Methylophaga]MBN47841.1 hypothetical protein [Methylophaga sp.]|tara:strand:- start:59337 stop:60236 length:900 start_codon:yes stop_codon:yes gene_type:complete